MYIYKIPQGLDSRLW